MIKIYGFILSLFIACLIITVSAQTCKGQNGTAPIPHTQILVNRNIDSVHDSLLCEIRRLTQIEDSLVAKQKRKKK
jgi:hypothetical protein